MLVSIFLKLLTCFLLQYELKKQLTKFIHLATIKSSFNQISDFLVKFTSLLPESYKYSILR